MKFIKKIFSISSALILLSTFANNTNVKAANFGLGSEVAVKTRIEVPVGKSRIIRLPQKPERIALSNPGIAYVLMITPEEVQIIGRNPGSTNLFVWFPPSANAKSGTPSKIHGSEIVVGLPSPPHITSTPTIEMVSGEFSELIYLGYPSEKVTNGFPANVSGPITDMPEPCLAPGCI
ncbi:MAG TPA: pilus assembly protein N-terminal domain-containing protein [Vampirovibrionales bacterium]